MDEKKKYSKKDVEHTLETIVTVGSALVTITTAVIKAFFSGKKD